MTQDNFFALHRLLFPYVKYRSLRTSGRDHRVRQRKGAANGIVPSSTRLAVAIRYFAGGSPYDLGGLFAISIKEVYRSGVGIIVDIINNCHELSIQFPMDHASQKKVALGFKAKSVAGFDCCIGAIDGILIWTECPSADDCIRSKNGPLKYMCGRKKKFGLNMMGTVDAEGRFLNIQIGHPGSTLDYLAFATSDLKAKLEEPGFLAPGMVLFGDNAYGNCSYMVTPIKEPDLAKTLIRSIFINHRFGFMWSVPLASWCIVGGSCGDRFIHDLGLQKCVLWFMPCVVSTTSALTCAFQTQRNHLQRI